MGGPAVGSFLKGKDTSLQRLSCTKMTETIPIIDCAVQNLQKPPRAPSARRPVLAGCVVHLDSSIALHDAGEAELLVLQHPRSLARVKQVGDVDAKVALQPEDVPIAPMQHLHHLQDCTQVLLRLTDPSETASPSSPFSGLTLDLWAHIRPRRLSDMRFKRSCCCITVGDTLTAALS